MIKRKIGNVYCILLIFMYIFAFNIVGFFDSAIIAFLLLLPPFFFLPEMRRSIFAIVFSRKFWNLTITYILFILWIFIAVKINRQNDFSYIPTLIHLYFTLIIGIFLFSYCSAKKRTDLIINWIVVAFVIQSVIIISAIISPTLRELILQTKSASEVERANHYVYRGMSLSSSSFFGLSIAYGLLLLVYFDKANSYREKNLFVRLLSFGLLLIGAGSAGRTALIGVVFGIALYLFENFNVRRSKGISPQRVLAFVLGIGAFAGIAAFVVFLFNNYASAKTMRVFNNFWAYISEFFTESSGGVFHTTSSDALFSNMFFLVDFPTFIKGHGLYSLGSGYYMRTDSGYMRTVLYVGFLSLVFLFLIQKQILDFCDLKKKNTILYWLILALIIALQVKGEVLGFAILFNSTLFLFVLAYKRDDSQLLKERKQCL